MWLNPIVGAVEPALPWLASYMCEVDVGVIMRHVVFHKQVGPLYVDSTAVSRFRYLGVQLPLSTRTEDASR